jgi:hypothetical protein
MNSTTTTPAPASSPAPGFTASRTRLWTGRAFSTLAVLFLAMDGAMKLIRPPAVVQGTLDLGYPEAAITGIGVALLASTLLYAVSRTSLLGAILLTGYLGGAVATHVRVANPWMSHTLFPVYIAILIWGGLCLRHPRLAALCLGR